MRTLFIQKLAEETFSSFKIEIVTQKIKYIKAIAIPLFSKYSTLHEMKTCMHFAYIRIWQLHHHPVRLLYVISGTKCAWALLSRWAARKFLQYPDKDFSTTYVLFNRDPIQLLKIQLGMKFWQNDNFHNLLWQNLIQILSYFS